ncbi:DUF1822 family protein [Fischerella muscicola]|uniref:DUF1822 family protein n=1 Tax=Fischerella muscicola TaxID=92938 RepID=UPI0015E12413|nr:DUF1822 family protein [Fischerella muscicola]
MTPQQQREAIARVANLLQTQPETEALWVQYLTLVDSQGTLEQQQAGIRQTAAWLESHFEAPAVREKYLILVNRVGTTQQQQAALVETAQWLESHPEDTYVREQYLVLVENAGTRQQQQQAINQTTTWLQSHPEDRYVRGQYLAFIGEVGTQQQQQRAVAETTIWLRSHLQDQYVREQYLALVNRLSPINIRQVEPTRRVNLRQLQQVLTSIGDVLDTLISNTTEANLAFRSTTGTWQELDLQEFPLYSQIVQLKIATRLEEDEKLSVRVQLQATNNETYLPEGLQLILLSLSGDVLYEDQAESTRELIEVILPDGEPADSFTAQIIFGDVSIAKDFEV